MSVYEGDPGDYVVDRELFKRATDFRIELLRLRRDTWMDQGFDVPKMLTKWRRARAYIEADSTIVNSRGPLEVINGIAIGHANSDQTYEAIADRIYQGEPPEAASVLASKIIKAQAVFADENLPYYDRLDEYTNTITERAASLRATSLAAIERGEPEALGYRLLGMAAYWGAAADTLLRNTLQDQIAEEFVR